MSIKAKCQSCLIAGLLLVSASGWGNTVQTAADSEASARLQSAVRLIESDKKVESGRVSSLLQPLVDQGNTKAAVWLGRAYLDGLAGVEKDSKRAFSYFEQAGGHNGKDPEAQFELGRAYMNGEGTDRNLIAAYMWTALSAGQTGDWSADAKHQKNKLEQQLTEQQLEKADQLVDQLKSIYLKQL